MIRIRWNTLSAFALLAVPSLAVAAPPEHWSEDWCREWNHSGSRAHACEVRDVEVARRPSVLHVAPGQNGGIEVAAGGGAGLVVRAKVEAWASTEEAARAIVAQVKITTDGGQLGAEGPERENGPGWSVSFRVLAPANQALDLSAENGPIGVYDMTGKMVLETQNGPIGIVGGGGDVLARAQNGPVSVTLKGHGWTGRGLDARAVNGPVSLTIPKDYDADLEYGTLNGPSTGDGNVFALGKRAGYSHVRLGKGGASLSVTTTNGPFAMHTESR